MNEEIVGPNLKRLFAIYLAREAVPPGGGLSSVTTFFQDKTKRNLIINNATSKLNMDIKTLRQYYQEKSGEEIAGMLIEKIEKRKLEQRKNKGQ